MAVAGKYDVAIIGGGLAGLAAAIEINRAGRSVILFEKESYPFHKVCGEYVSMESWSYLEHLGLNLKSLDLPRINYLDLSGISGNLFRTKLPLGGFGISRWKMDSALAAIAKANGVILLEETKVEDAKFDGESFHVFATTPAGKIETKATICFGAFGKRSNLDVKWKRSFLTSQDKKLDNFLAVKYHLTIAQKPETIALHNFRNGYCGISRIERDKYCLCYMVKATELQKAGNDIARMERDILSQNPNLQKIFSNAKVVEGFPITISQINFSDKSRIEDHILMLGDTAGMITPLCGNGMSIALHTAKTGAALAVEYLQGKISREKMERSYSREWNNNFAKRLAAGRFLQKFFGSGTASNVFVSLMKRFPFLARPLIRLTHGKPF